MFKIAGDETIDWLRAAGNFAIDLVYPKRCAGCGAYGVWLCDDCDHRLVRFAPPLCDRCGVPTALNACQCEDLPIALSWVRSIGPFDGWLRGAVVQIKYHGEWGRCISLGPPLADVLDGLPCDAMVPVPIHASRRRQRGFNQSRILAEHAASHAACQVRDVLQRVRPTASQVSLGGEARRVNVKGSIVVTEGANLSGLHVVLVDDVITTGSTIQACVEALNVAGVRSIGAITVARELT